MGDGARTVLESDTESNNAIRGGPLQAGLARMPAKPQVDPAQMTFDQGA